MNKQFWLTFFLLFAFLLQCTKTSAQAPAAAPTGPPNITAILEKGGQFTSFVRLLANTQQDDQINTQLNNSNQGLTVFAPTDNAFASLKSGALNSLNDQQKVQLVQFHILPTSMSMSQFQTASNPLRTQAGNSNDGEFPLNVTTSGNQVNLTTGVDQTTVANTIFTGSNLAVYQVDQVLLPLDLFGSQAPAPAPSKPEKDIPVGAATPKGSSDDASVDNSGALISNHPAALTMASLVVAALATVSVWLH